MSSRAGETISLVTVSTLFPNAIQPSHGIFVQTRLRKLIDDGRARAQVVAPIAWLPPYVRYGAHGLRAVSHHELHHGIDVFHPRYLVIPKLGMGITPYTLYRSMRAQLKSLLAAGAR